MSKKIKRPAEELLSVDQMIHDLVHRRIGFFKEGHCLLECSIEDFLSNEMLWSLLPLEAQRYLVLWQSEESPSIPAGLQSKD